MKARNALALLALLSLAVIMMPLPVAAANLSMTPSEGSVGTEVTIPMISSYGTGRYYIYWGETERLVTQGDIAAGQTSITFLVPEAPRGKTKITLKVSDKVFQGEFKITPSIVLTADRGPVGSELTVLGKGFNGSETNIRLTYDGTAIDTTIQADSRGTWQKTFKIPASIRGGHIIDADGSTPASEVADRTFTVVPRITLNPNSGWVGTVVNVSGTGFGRSETNITVTYDAISVKTGIACDSTGTWQSGFSIPSSTKGSHSVRAAGASTPPTEVSEFVFMVSPGIKVELASGYLGDIIRTGDNLWVSGFGFEENESGIQVTYDGVMLLGGLIADAKGSWSAQVSVPLSTKGRHTIDASGSTTRADTVADSTIVISPSIELNKTSGAIGDEVVVSGTGFGGSQAITVIYDGTQVSTTASTDTRGRFSTTFKVPLGKAGKHAITVTDASAAVASLTFSVESTPPPVPKLILPEPGSKSGFLGKTKLEFDWSDIDDPSGVSYVLEIGQSSDFSGAVLRKEGLKQSKYALTDSEALDKGKYYWRVRAIDGAGNQSDWTMANLFTVGVMELWQLIAIAVAVMAVIAIIVWRVKFMMRR